MVSSTEGGSRFPNPEKERVEREKAGDLLERFLHELGIEHWDPEKKATWLRELNFDELMNSLFVLNGILRNHEETQYYEGKIVKGIVSQGGLDSDPMFEPPEKADEEFRDVFEKMKDGLNSETLKNAAARLYAGIVLGHMFPDGNGRLARTLYALLTQDKVTQEMIMKRNRATTEFAHNIVAASLQSLLRAAGLDADHYADYLVLHEGTSVSDMDIAKYIAARRLLVKQGKEVGKLIEWTELDEPTKKDFTDEYALVRKELFWTAQRIIERFPDSIAEMLDPAIGVAPVQANG